jgi:hypothetical protein
MDKDYRGGVRRPGIAGPLFKLGVVGLTFYAIGSFINSFKPDIKDFEHQRRTISRIETFIENEEFIKASEAINVASYMQLIDSIDVIDFNSKKKQGIFRRDSQRVLDNNKNEGTIDSLLQVASEMEYPEDDFINSLRNQRVKYDEREFFNNILENLSNPKRTIALCEEYLENNPEGAFKSEGINILMGAQYLQVISSSKLFHNVPEFLKNADALINTIQEYSLSRDELNMMVDTNDLKNSFNNLINSKYKVVTSSSDIKNGALVLYLPNKDEMLVNENLASLTNALNINGFYFGLYYSSSASSNAHHVFFPNKQELGRKEDLFNTTNNFKKSQGNEVQIYTEDLYLMVKQDISAVEKNLMMSRFEALGSIIGFDLVKPRVYSVDINKDDITDVGADNDKDILKGLY